MEPDKNEMRTNMRINITTKMGSILLAFCMMVVSILGSNQVSVNAAGRVQINKTAVTLQAGERQQLLLENVPKNGKVTWRSTSKSKAAVSKKGIVTAKKQGRATVKAQLSYKTGGKKITKTFSCKVTIIKKKPARKSLVVYFSAPVQERSGQVDGISSASRTATGKIYKGNTEYIAELVCKETNADIFEIIPQKAYADTYEQMVERAEREQDERPAIKNKVKNISGYDTIYVG